MASCRGIEDEKWHFSCFCISKKEIIFPSNEVPGGPFKLAPGMCVCERAPQVHIVNVHRGQVLVSTSLWDF